MNEERLNMLFFFIGYLASYVGIIPLFLLALKRKHNGSYPNILIAILLAHIISDYTTAYLGRRYINNLFMTHVWPLIELPLWSFFFSLLFKKDRKMKKMVLIITCAGTLFSLLNTLFVQPLDTFNTYGRAVTSLIIICFCLFYFFLFPESDSNLGFWVCAMLLIYNGSNVLLFVFSNYLLQQPPLVNHIIWAFHNLLLIGLYGGIVADAFLWKKYPVKTQSP